MRLKILTWNIHKGFSIANRFTLHLMRDILREIGPDVVFLQEVQGQHHGKKHIRDWPTEGHFEYLADSVWPHYAYGQNAVYREGHHGNAILSKYPIKHWWNVDLTLHKREMRGLLHTEIDLPGSRHPVHLLNTHINLLHAHRMRQMAIICDHMKKKIPVEQPLILAGDFNDWGLSLTPQLWKRMRVRDLHHALHGAHAKTFPCFHPMLSLDRIYVRHVTPLLVEVLDGSIWGGLSDHLPILAEVEIG